LKLKASERNASEESALEDTSSKARSSEARLSEASHQKPPELTKYSVRSVQPLTLRMPLQPPSLQLVSTSRQE